MIYPADSVIHLLNNWGLENMKNSLIGTSQAGVETYLLPLNMRLERELQTTNATSRPWSSDILRFAVCH